MQISFLSSSSAPICSSCSSCSSSAQDDSSPCSLDELDVSVLFSFFGCGLQDYSHHHPHTPIMDYTLQASLTGYSEVLVEVFYCRLPQKPPVSLLKWLWCENAFSVLKRFFSSSEFVWKYCFSSCKLETNQFDKTFFLLTFFGGNPGQPFKGSFIPGPRHQTCNISYTCRYNGGWKIFWHLWNCLTTSNLHTCYSPLWHQRQSWPTGGKRWIKCWKLWKQWWW